MSADENVVVTLDDFEQRLMVNGLTDFRNDLLREDIVDKAHVWLKEHGYAVPV